MRPKILRIVALAQHLSVPIFQTSPLSLIHKYSRFVYQIFRFRVLGGQVQLSDLYPCLNDRTSSTRIDSHYFYQAIWAFKKILRSGAKQHVDIASDVQFVGMLTTITHVTFIDIRPLLVTLEQFASKEGSVLELPFVTNSIHSLSSLSVVEHVGLGRYGDPLDPSGSSKAFRELIRVLAPQGSLYITLPIGRSRVCFNAHRVFSPEEIVDAFSDLELSNLSVVDDSGNYHENTSVSGWNSLEFGCGMFHFCKPIT